MTDNRVLTADEIDEALGVHSQTSTSTKIMMHGVARAIESAVVVKVNAAPQASAEVSATPRPTDDELWDQTLRERDEYHDMADQLAAQIAAITGEEIGEHSSANDPWRNAMLAADDFIAAQLRKMCTGPAAEDSAKGADVALPPLPRLIPVEHFEKQQAMWEYARAAVLADRQQRKPWPMEEQPDGTVTPVDPIDRQQRGGDDFSGVQPPMRYVAGVNVDVLRRAALAAQPAASAEPSDEEIITQAKDWCDDPNVGAIVFTNHGDCIAFARALLSRYGRPAGDAQHYEAALRQIGDYAHDHSTGPAVPDALWAVRSLAYDALSDAPVAAQKADEVECGCGDIYPADSYGAGFIDALGHCPNCEAACEAAAPFDDSQKADDGRTGMADNRAIQWIASGDTGMSSKAIWAHFMEVTPEDGWFHPLDPSDFGRCARLLKIMPEWRDRICEMSHKSAAWAALTARWDIIEKTMEDEVGIDWSKGTRAPQTYALMKAILGSVNP